MTNNERVEDVVGFLSDYIGKSVDSIAKEAGVVTAAKNKNAIVIRNLLNKQYGKGYITLLFNGENAQMKTVCLNDKGFPCESMSFPAFSFDEIIKETWENSVLRRSLSVPFAICVFQKIKDRVVFVKVFAWNMPEDVLDNDVKTVWEQTVDVIKSGNIVKNESGSRVRLNFPKESETKVCHVRPHGKDGLDLSRLPKPDDKTNYLGLPKQSFWLNKNFIYKVIQAS